MNQKETIYIAGPECFFLNGNEHLASMRKLSEAHGHGVSLPNDTPLDLNNEDLRLNADNIFKNLEEIIYDSTMIISDLDKFRGGESDGGTIFEIGMAHALGLKSYGYSRDIRPLVWTDQRLSNDDKHIYDEHGDIHHYSFLPFSPMIVATTKLVEGNYNDALNSYMADKYYGHTFGLKHEQVKGSGNNKVFIALRNYYDQAQVSELLESVDNKGYELVGPYFKDYDGEQEIASWLDEILNENLKRLDSCSYFIADLNDYRGYEPSNDVSFLSGYAFQVGKHISGFMDDTRVMRDKMPYLTHNNLSVDLALREVENFDYPINLMFASSMEITQGSLQEAINQLNKGESNE